MKCCRTSGCFSRICRRNTQVVPYYSVCVGYLHSHFMWVADRGFSDHLVFEESTLKAEKRSRDFAEDSSKRLGGTPSKPLNVHTAPHPIYVHTSLLLFSPNPRTARLVRCITAVWRPCVFLRNSHGYRQGFVPRGAITCLLPLSLGVFLADPELGGCITVQRGMFFSASGRLRAFVLCLLCARACVFCRSVERASRLMDLRRACVM